MDMYKERVVHVVVAVGMDTGYIGERCNERRICFATEYVFYCCGVDLIFSHRARTGEATGLGN